MSIPALLMHLAVDVPPHLVTATVLLVGVAVTLAFGWRRRGRAFSRHLPAMLFVTAGAATFWVAAFEPTRGLIRATVLTAVVALLIATVRAVRAAIEPATSAPGSVHMARRYVLAALLLAGAMLFYRLGSYSGPLLTWEAPVVAGYPNLGGFTRAYTQQRGVLDYTMDRFLWDEGLLSAGHTSLFFGAPTYALFHVVGFSPWTLRVVSVLTTLLSIAIIYVLASRFFGPIVGGAAAMALGLNHCVLFYGRYGSSPAGTLLAVLIAVWCTWRFLESERPRWWQAPACAAALYVATLQYSPARIVVVIILAFITAELTRRWRRLQWQQALGFAVIVLAAAGVWRLQSAFGTQDTFLMARGEQYFDLIQNPQYINELFDADLLGRPVSAETITLGDKLELLVRIVQVTLPQYVNLMRPLVERNPLTDVPRFGSLPQPYYAPLVVFVVWGFTHSVLRMRRWPHAFLLVWLVAGTLPLLLTNRVDTHRIVLFVIPLALWGALGVWEAARLLDDADVPIDVQHFLAALLALTIVYNDVHLLHREPRPRNIAAAAIAAEAAHAPGRVAVGALLNHRDMGWLQLAMLERTRRNPEHAGKMLDERTLQAAQDRSGATDTAVRKLRPLINDGTLLLAPTGRFRKLAAALQAEGVRVTERGAEEFHVLRLDAGAAATGIPDEALASLPTLVVARTPTPTSLSTGPHVSLSGLTPTDVQFGFAPPQLDRTWEDGPIVMRGVEYAHGIGMHAWCRMTYAVPTGAAVLQAVIGLSDEVHDCSTADVQFEVRDQNDQVLFRSDTIDATTPPQAIAVRVKQATTVTLAVTEGVNGRDCDHANWGAPVFVFDEP